MQRLGTLWNNVTERVRATRRTALAVLLSEHAPLDLRFVGTTLLQAALVGLGCGLIGAALFAGLELGERVVLEGLSGYVPLRAHGEAFAAGDSSHSVFRPWVLLFLPAIGGLIVGLLARIEPRVMGGGADAIIHAFHRGDARSPRRLLWLKPLATFATLSSGGAGGREGPAMLIGGTVGATVANLLRLGARERRVLLVAGIAGGISAVFRTPLGAALLAVEILYRDGFEAEALVPSVLSSVVAYSVVISIFGESTLFAYASRFPVPLTHLPLYLVLAVLVAAFALLFLKVHHGVTHVFDRLRVPPWTKPGLGGLVLGVLTSMVLWFAVRKGLTSGGGLGILGGGYGAVQLAISGSSWLPQGWWCVAVFLALAGAKMVATSLTLGSGGSAGDFAPSLAMGGLLGGAFGYAMQLLFPEAHIDPGAFALVGMGAFYGGVAHVPLAALVLVCELAGNYDLLVPLMLALTVSGVALRRASMYSAQIGEPHESPAYRGSIGLRLLQSRTVADVVTEHADHLRFEVATPMADVIEGLAAATWQDAFPVYEAGRLAGMIHRDALGMLHREADAMRGFLAGDLMREPVTVQESDDLHAATSLFLAQGVREIFVLDPEGQVVGFLDENDVVRALLEPPPASQPGRAR